MKLQAKHSKKYLALKDEKIVIQNDQGEDWEFLFENKPINPKSGEYGKLVLKGSSEPRYCLQPSSIFPHNGWLINISTEQNGNDSQLWRFIDKDDNGFFVIENKNNRIENSEKIIINKSCVDVCQEKTKNNDLIISYHVKTKIESQSNQRWKIK